MDLNIYTDGGSRGNPGISGYGLVIYDSHKKIIYKESKFLGVKTNNEAEYLGLIAALNWILNNKNTLNINHLHFYSDSQLLVRQMQGLYKVKSPNLKSLYAQSKSLVDQINLPYYFQDVRREYNYLADQLANQAMDQKGYEI